MSRLSPLPPIADIPFAGDNSSMTLPLPPQEPYSPPSTEGLWRPVREAAIGNAIFSSMIFVFLLAVGVFERNPDNSMKAEVLTPAFYLILPASVLALRRFRYRPLRVSLWIWAVLSGLGAMFGTLVLAMKWLS